MGIINAPSLANCHFLNMGEEVAELVDGGAEWLHIDIMDRHYVPNLCFPISLVKELKTCYPGIQMDIHLMVEKPEEYLLELSQAGADWVSFHLDSTKFSRRLIRDIHSLNMKAGVCINPSQMVDDIIPVMFDIDYAVLMSVEPGFAGQIFMKESLQRLDELKELRDKHQALFLISVDGGVDMNNAIACRDKGADILITGKYTVFDQGIPLSEACRKFSKIMNSNVQCAQQRAR